MSILAIALLILLGIILILIELLVVPGISVAGIGGVLLIIGGIVLGYHFHGTTAGNYILLASGVLMILLVVLALKLKTWQRFGLQSTIDSKVGVLKTEEIKEGDEGISISRLAPIGKAMFNEKLFEVHSEGEYIDENQPIIVIRISGNNKIFVKTKN
jgi:membrane-bound ClpP family serine protease